jgi:hypothetical protein
MQKKLPALTVRELINFLKDYPSQAHVMVYCANDAVPSGFVKDVYEQGYINKVKYESEDDFYNVVCLHVEKTDMEDNGLTKDDSNGFKDFEDYEDEDDDEGEEWKK